MAGGRAHPHLYPQTGESVKRKPLLPPTAGLEVLAAALTWVVVLAAILVVTGSGGAVPSGVPGTWTIALVAALAVALTLGLALSPLPLGASYVAAHLAGGVVVVAVEEGPRLPWAWHALPALAALFARGAILLDRGGKTRAHAVTRHGEQVE